MSGKISDRFLKKHINATMRILDKDPPINISNPQTLAKIYTYQPFIKDVVGGAISFNYFPNISGKDFFLFGDSHFSEEEKCDPTKGNSEDLVDMFKRVFSENPNQIDFYLEYNVMEIGEKKGQHGFVGGPLGRTIEEFEDCLQINKTRCANQYPQLRVHYVDYRHTWYDDKNPKKLPKMKSFITKFKSRVQKKVKGPIDKNDIPDIVEFFGFLTPEMMKEYFTAYFEEEYGSNIYNRLKAKADPSNKYFNEIFNPKWTYNITELTNTKNRIYKQIIKDGVKVEYSFYDKNGNSVDYHELIKKFFWKTHAKEAQRYQSKVDKLKSTNDVNEVRKVMRSLEAILTDISCWVMDLYFLHRMFKKSLQDSTEVWMYAGDFHVGRYVTFIEEYLYPISNGGSKYKAKNVAGLFRCVNMKNFNNWEKY